LFLLREGINNRRIGEFGFTEEFSVGMKLKRCFLVSVNHVENRAEVHFIRLSRTECEIVIGSNSDLNME